MVILLSLFLNLLALPTFASDSNSQSVFDVIPGGFGVQSVETEAPPSPTSDNERYNILKSHQAKNQQVNNQTVTVSNNKSTVAPSKDNTVNYNQSNKRRYNNKYYYGHTRSAHRHTNTYSKHVASREVTVSNHPQQSSRGVTQSSQSQKETPSYSEENMPLYPENTGNESKAPVPQSTKAAEPSLLNVFGSLILVLGLILGVFWLYSRLKGIDTSGILGMKLGDRNTYKFNLLSSIALGQGKNIHVVEVNGKRLVIGSTSNNINLLTEIEKEAAEAQKKADVGPQQESDLTEQDTANKEEDMMDYISPEGYELGYADVYKEYLREKDQSENSEEDSKN